jgi:ammonium transporter Rh
VQGEKADGACCCRTAHQGGSCLIRQQLLLRRSFIELDLPLLIDAAFAAGAAMISFGAVLGKIPLAQLTWLLVLQVPIYAFNAYLATEVQGSTMLLH